MGMLPQDFYKMTPAEFYLASRGFIKKKWKEWEHTRFISYTMASTVAKKMPKLEKWLPLPTDDKSKYDDPDRIKAVMDKAKAM